MQIEGSKRWRLHGPVNKQNELDRFPSRDFAQGELGAPILDVVLEPGTNGALILWPPGDLLCLPRGMIHQAISCDSHSLHITVSCGFHNTYADFLDVAFPKLIQAACKVAHGKLGLMARKCCRLKKAFLVNCLKILKILNRAKILVLGNRVFCMCSRRGWNQFCPKWCETFPWTRPLASPSTPWPRLFCTVVSLIRFWMLTIMREQLGTILLYTYLDLIPFTNRI